MFRFVLRKSFAIVQLWRGLLSPEEQQQHSPVEVPTLRQALPRLKSREHMYHIPSVRQCQNPRKKSRFSQPVSHLQGPLQQSCLDQAGLLFLRETGRSSTSGRRCYRAQEPWPNMANDFTSIKAINVIPTSKRVLSTMLWISRPDLRYTSATR